MGDAKYERDRRLVTLIRKHFLAHSFEFSIDLKWARTKH